MKALKMLPLLLLLAGSAAVQAQGIKDEKNIFTYVDKMPEFDGNVNAYIANTITYPEAARKASTEGRVIIKFVIDESGNVQNALVERGVNPLLDAEALRVVEGMPSWKPGMQNGKPVKVYFRVPISFRLTKEPKKSRG